MTVVGRVETTAFKDDTSGEEHAANMIAAFRALCQRLIGHFLPRLEAVAACLTKILVRWHIPITSNDIACSIGGQYRSLRLIALRMMRSKIFYKIIEFRGRTALTQREGRGVRSVVPFAYYDDGLCGGVVYSSDI